MALDLVLKAQLVEAREKIVQQVVELEDRATNKGIAREGGPPDYSSVVTDLQSQLRAIDEMLESDEPDEGC